MVTIYRVVDRGALAEEVLKNVANNVLREMCENNKKVEKEMSSYLDCEHKVETKDPTRSKYNMAIHERTFSGGVGDKDRSD